MMTKLAVAALAALGIALQAAFLHAAVAAPLDAAAADLAAARRPATFEETIVVRAPAKGPAKLATAPAAMVGRR
jgi:hypothetical protein